MNRAPARIAVGRCREPQVGEVGVEPGHHGIRRAGRRPAIDRLLVHPGGGMAGGHDVEARVTQLALEPARAEDQDAPDARLVVGEVDRGRAGGRDHGVGRDRRAHRREAGLT